MQSELLPCPFCGGPGEYGNVEMGHAIIYCRDCGAEGPQAGDDAGAEEAWDTRATPSAIVAETVERVAREIEGPLMPAGYYHERARQLRAALSSTPAGGEDASPMIDPPAPDAEVRLPQRHE